MSLVFNILLILYKHLSTLALLFATIADLGIVKSVRVLERVSMEIIRGVCIYSILKNYC
jgi:hypothetical protein